MASPAGLHLQQKEAANLDCIHCGLCLSVCPTYLQVANEADSPRGRIYLINAMKDGEIESSNAVFARHMQLCLECRACETACPSGVRFSLMMNDARAAIRARAEPSIMARMTRSLVFELLLPNHRPLHALFRLLRFYQQSGMQRLVRASGILKLFPARLRKMESLLPHVPPYPDYGLADSMAEGRARAAFFEGCIMPELFGPVHEATLRVLKKNNVAVGLPRGQTCCGALHVHDGEIELARELARKNIDAFERGGADCIVVNAAGCGAALKEYGHLLRDDPAYGARAAAFSARVKDISELLDAIGISRDMGRMDIRVTYDDPCHLLHGQGIRDAPRRLLRSIPGLELVELRDSDRCCGSAGIYNITQPEMSDSILSDKIENLARTGAQTVASGNPGCLLQLEAGLRARGIPMRAVHPVQLLDEAYRYDHHQGTKTPRNNK